MMNRRIPDIPNIGQYHQHFTQVAPTFKNEPASHRGCNDKCCYILFIILTLICLGIGIFFISQVNVKQLETIYANSTSTNPSKVTPAQTFDVQNLKPGIPIVLGMIAFTIVLAIIFSILLVKFPKCMFYTMLSSGAILLIALAILFFLIGLFPVGIILLVLLLFYGLFLYCSRNKIRTGIVLLKTASQFVSQKPSVFLAPIIMTFVIIAFQVFWLAGLVGIILYTGDAKTKQQIKNQQIINGIFGTIWVFLQIFYSFFFYYCIVFLIATATAFWYYNVEGNYLCVGIKRIITNHLGSISFGAFLIAIVSMARSSAERQARENQGAAAICLCLLACCLSMIENLLQVLNNNAFITMAVTGESYIDSAKSTISIILNNFWLFIIIDAISSLLKVTGILFICSVPAIVGFFLLRATAQNEDDGAYIAIGTIVIILIAIVIGSIFLSVLSQALSCVFIFYCLDKRFMEMGYPSPQNVPPTMQKLFESLSSSANSQGFAGFNPPPPNNQALYNNQPYNSSFNNTSYPQPNYGNNYGQNYGPANANPYLNQRSSVYPPV